MKIAAAALIAVSLAGCAAFDPEPMPILNPVTTITIKEDPLLGFPRDDIIGRAVWNGSTCEITLKNYPIGAGHEFLHCISGKWHPEESATFPGNNDHIYEDAACPD